MYIGCSLGSEIEIKIPFRDFETLQSKGRELLLNHYGLEFSHMVKVRDSHIWERLRIYFIKNQYKFQNIGIPNKSKRQRGVRK